MQNAKLWFKNYKFLVAIDIIDEIRPLQAASVLGLIAAVISRLNSYPCQGATILRDSNG